MTASRVSQWLLVAPFIALIASGGTVQAVLDLGRGERPQALDLFLHAPTQTRLRAYEHDMEERAWSVALSRPAMRYALFTLFHDLGPKALTGHSGWLYYRPDVDFLIQPWPVAPGPGAPDAGDPPAAITAYRDALAVRGIALLVVPVPGKASAYPDRLSRRSLDGRGPVHAHAQRLMDQLREAGVAYVDLYAAYAQARARNDETALYLAQDTHWSPEGMRLAAQAVAERIRAEGWAPDGDGSYGQREIVDNRTGDVLRMAGSDAIFRRFGPEQVVCSQVIDPATGEPSKDDPDSPVLVLGDSFLRIYERDAPGSAGFVAHLARELRRPVASLMSDGGASTVVRRELQRKPGLLRNTRVLVWEFAERDLRSGLDGWQVVPLPEETR